MRGLGHKHKLTQTVLQTMLPDNFAGLLKHAILLLHGLKYHASSHTRSYASMTLAKHTICFHYSIICVKRAVVQLLNKYGQKPDIR